MTNDETIIHLAESFDGEITAYVSDYHRCRNRNPAPEGGIMDIDPKDFVVCLPIVKPKTLKEIKSDNKE